MFSGSFVYEIPLLRGKGWMDKAFGGWAISGLITKSTGLPVYVISGRDYSLTGVGFDRPNLVGNPTRSHSSTADFIQQYFNTSAFALPQVGQYGNLGRNTMVGPGSYNLDGSIFRGFRLRERMSLQFRAEFFNSFNHANLANPVSNIGAATVGRILSASDPRILQFGLKLIY